MPFELKAADILLYRSDSVVSRAIRFVDDTEVSHAGLYLGDGTVGEALTNGGLQRQPFQRSITGSQWVAVRRLANTPPAMQPVLDKAENYLNHGERYAFGQIFLLAGICLLRRANLSNPLVRRMAQAVIDKAAAFVRRCQSDGTQPMICSEFVYRAYHEAVQGADNPYNIEVTEFWSAASRPLILGWRRREPSVAIPPESLLGTIQAQHGSLDAALESATARATVAPVVSDEELETIIEACLSDPAGTNPKAMLEAGPEVGMDESAPVHRELRRGVA